jgi:hypothetical protein
MWTEGRNAENSSEKLLGEGGRLSWKKRTHFLKFRDRVTANGQHEGAVSMCFQKCHAGNKEESLKEQAPDFKTFRLPNKYFPYKVEV